VGAVDKGWLRARRTIVASDAVNFLAAVVLYFLAVGSVRGFAYTLGLTTIIDLVVVFTFTHPTMLLLARTKFFGEGHRFSGMDPRLLGVAGTHYAGRGRIVVPAAAGAVAGALADDLPRETIADRRAAKQAAARAEQSGPDLSAASSDAPGAGATAEDRSTERNES
jgi:preprotein translocase subunit SecD